ncbi:glycoside hydrolase family 2 protein [Rathayibacter tanaceti]|uniref:beta-mannosidase n=2 Tax=Rathayibacter tanaceti TaxID=1671680 RepID=A0A162GK62_9MICO|nr:beta-mannosidase [Rathayibacter tanaceti]KZX22549.1 Exo-beta-D-glucosaminidase precursor [Rathayibacter tanaceti]QHC54773.1 glycoside hydrolase family 2 protein [Rathayibacter tanaceti]TCO37406.1 beta-mannosidase [Rathayibacter tanaceti]
MIVRTPLTSWTVEASGSAVPAAVGSAGAIAATVPGSVHTDLLAAGLIDDPFLDENEKTQSWIGRTDWTYRTVVDWNPDGSEHHELLFEGIDTIATISLNGAALASTRNMHRSHRIDVTGMLVPGANELEVAISSPLRAADAASLELGYRPHTNHHPYNAIRKMACSFGWDWGIDTATSALWKPVTLETWSGARLRDVALAGVVVGGVPRLRGTAHVTGEVSAHVVVSIAGDDHRLTTVDGVARFDVPVDGAALWWPRGYGDAALHDVRVRLVSGDDALDERAHRVGFRSVEARSTPDDAGTGFAIIVNDQEIHVRGANWIPDDAFLHRVDRARYARRLAQAEFANINLVRVWGGGIFESEDFYAECDERGILTWQDFLLACAAYAEDEPLWSEFEAEAREAIIRLAAHPSLVVLNGNNENIWGYQDWDWDKKLDGRTWGAGYYYDLFPALVAELAPHVAYTPGSPFSPDRAAHQNDPDSGTVHVWDLWNQKDWPHYRDSRPRFVSEFGWQGPPTWSTLTRAVHDDPLTPESPGMLIHQKAIKGNDKLTDGLTAHFPLPNTMADWHWAMSLNQAIAIRTAIEWYRSLTPHCTGTIVWQLNDCWPSTSWAAVDADERPKPLLYALKQAHADRMITIQPDGGTGLRLALVNDSTKDWAGPVEVQRLHFSGDVLERFTVHVAVPAGSSRNVVLDFPLTRPDDVANELLVATFDGERALWFFAEYRASGLQPARVSVDVRRDGDVHLVRVTAENLVRELTLLVDRVASDAVADRALETLLPGETVEFRVRGTSEADPEQFAHALVLRCANDLV